ncbi:MAG: acetolactate synthase small subunit [Acidimicrobiia bacterium]|nr:acetolactate synthase small subunit [Acidimicrobiia bacterium]
MTDTARFHTVVTTVENKPGVLARVAGLFSRRGYNIESLAVAPTDDDRFSRITFTVDVASASLDQVVKQLDKLVNVVDIRELDPATAVERELMLVIVDIAADRRGELLDLVRIFEAKVLSVGPDQMMVSLSGRPDRIDDFEALLEPFGIVEIQRTGRVALRRLDSSGAET